MVTPASRTADSADATETDCDVTVKDEPPLNSIPRCKPCVINVAAEARINNPENAYQIFLLPIKSTEVSPRYKRPPNPEYLAITYTSSCSCLFLHNSQ